MTSSTLLTDELKGLALDKDEYIDLLSKLIGDSKHVQNNPRQGLVPQEQVMMPHIMAVLEPYSTEKGGPLEIQQLVFKEGRPNLKIVYKGTHETKTIGLIGSHLDVVPANPESWDRDPFQLSVEGDKLYGRGTTDCLGHVAMITLLMKEVAERKPTLQRTIVVLFIVGEEGGEVGAGVDMVVKGGHVDLLKNSGTCYWVDSADSQPCIGSAGVLQWHLKATGRLFHSGLPHRGINSLEFIMEALKILQERFYQDFPPHSLEEKYKFATPSTMKPTQVECAKGALNQLPPWTTVSGDVRFTPFYDPVDIINAIQGYVKDLNENLEKVPTRGPCSKYTLDGDVDVKRGVLEMKFADDIEGVRQMEGVACDLDSPGLAAMISAVKEVKGHAAPYSLTGSLPLVRQMQNEGFDIQITGFGLSTTYHADNEYALLSDMQDAFQILLRTIAISEQNI